MRIQTFIIIILLSSCINLTKNKLSYWETKKQEFKYQNLKEFYSDSILRIEYKSLKPFSHEIFDSTIGDKVYLYSWQERDTSKNEFTVIQDDGELGLRIYYFVLDKNDSLLSWTQIGGKGTEGIYSFETWTIIKNKDTLINIGAITQWYDLEKQMIMEKTKGDTTFSYLIIDSQGKFIERIFKEVKVLKFENE